MGNGGSNPFSLFFSARLLPSGCSGLFYSTMRRNGLPAELYSEIVEHVVDRPSLLTLSTASKSLSKEVFRVLYRQIHLRSFKSFDMIALRAGQRPDLCRLTRSLEIRRDFDSEDYLWAEDRRTSLATLLSNMPCLIRLDLHFEMADDMWSTLTSSTTSSGAQLRHFRCWLRHRSNPLHAISFFESQPSITHLQLSSAWEIHDVLFSHIPPSTLSNLALLEGYFHPISPFFMDRPIRRLNIHNDDTFQFQVDTHIPVSVEVLRINCCPITFPILPTVRYLDLVCSKCKACDRCIQVSYLLTKIYCSCTIYLTKLASSPRSLPSFSVILHGSKNLLSTPCSIYVLPSK